jgi:hypothetical protein
MWFYAINNAQFGPCDDPKVKELIAAQQISPSTLVWKEGMSTWMPANETPLAPLFATGQVIAPAPLIAPPASVQPYTSWKSPAQQMDEIQKLFTWAWICLLGSLITFGLSAIASVVLFYILLFRCWALIQDGYARTTPGKAVGYCFIPFYNFYWIFQAYPGFAKDANGYFIRHGLPIARLDEGLPTALCVFILLSAIPYVNFVTSVVALILQIIMFNNFKNAAIEIIRQKQIRGLI